MMRGASHAHRPRIGLRWLMLGLAVLAVVAAGGFVRQALVSRQIDREIASLKTESDQLRAKNFKIASLSGSLDQQEFLEREARTTLNLQKVGEQVVIVKPASAPAMQPSILAPVPVGTLTNAGKWWLYFTDRTTYDRDAAALHDAAGQTIN